MWFVCQSFLWQLLKFKEISTREVDGKMTTEKTSIIIYLVDEQHSGDKLCLTLLPPFCHFDVDLLPHLPLDLASVSCMVLKKVNVS